MKRIILVAICLYSLNIMASTEEIQTRLNGMTTEIEQIFTKKKSVPADTLFQRAKEARSIFDNKELASKIRIDANLLYSGFIGLYAQEEKSEEYGKKSYAALKENFSIDPSHKNASLRFADAILGIHSSPFCFIIKIRYGVGNLRRDLILSMDNLKQFLPDQDARAQLEKLEKITF